MNLARVKSLVTCSWLKHAISCHPSFCLLEASWAPKGKGHENFLDKHIPSAQFFDMWEGVSPTKFLPRELPDAKIFEQYSQELGINNDSHIVIYDKSLAFFSSRLWYTFKVFGHENVSVLDGGFPLWQHQGLHIESGDTPASDLGNYKVKDLKKSMLKSYDEMINNAQQNKFQIVDVRNPNFFRGLKDEPSPATIAAVTSAGFEEPNSMVKGHMPHSFNIENDEFIDKNTNCIISGEKLQQLFKSADVDINKPIAAHCYNGVSACLVPLAATRLEQHTDISLYIGSWTEFGQRASSKDVEVTESQENFPVSGG